MSAVYLGIAAFGIVSFAAAVYLLLNHIFDRGNKDD